MVSQGLGSLKGGELYFTAESNSKEVNFKKEMDNAHKRAPAWKNRERQWPT